MLNKFIGIGRWASDIELKYTKNGKAVANASIAINDDFGSETSVTFLQVVMWGKTAENTAEYSKKGRMVAIEGKIKNRKWESDNGTRYITEVIADNVRFLESSRNDRGQGDPNDPPARQYDKDPFKDDGKPIDPADLDLPF